ncbi:DUF3492 domain-containing protein, partial [Streptomyces pinistramenti]|uniref:DUF3492 domain-containing protein n=1 Tax=Streptomyces pinistramenti TaxID=2884812 RepID=UPI001D0837D1
MRIGLLTEGADPYAPGESYLWCERLVRGLTGHEFDVYALTDDARRTAGHRPAPPPQVHRVRRAPLQGPAPAARSRRQDDRHRTPARRERRRFAQHFGDLAAAFAAAPPGAATPAAAATTEADRFAAGLYGLADLARDIHLAALFRSEDTLRILERVCHAPGTLHAAHAAQVPDLLSATDQLARALRPLSLDWYGGEGTPGLAAADLCHATSTGPAALPGLLAKRFFGTPLLVTEYGARLREHYLAHAATPLGAPVRALLAAFRKALAAETYAQAALITPGHTHTRRWQERCGADPARLRTVRPGLDAAPFAAVPDAAADDSATLMWVGAVEPAKDLAGLLRAFAAVRTAAPHATLRIIGGPSGDPEAPGYLAHCRALAGQLFPDRAAGRNPVSFERIGSPAAPTLADAYASGTVLVLPSIAEGFPRPLVEAMFCGRATVSTDVGAVREVIGGTGLVVPARDPSALADACCALLRDPARRARHGAAARARAHELVTT